MGDGRIGVHFAHFPSGEAGVRRELYTAHGRGPNKRLEHRGNVKQLLPKSRVGAPFKSFRNPCEDARTCGEVGAALGGTPAQREHSFLGFCAKLSSPAENPARPSKEGILFFTWEHPPLTQQPQGPGRAESVSQSSYSYPP